MNQAMQITFAGAAGTVTGSRYLVETGPSRFLVDAGLFQGLKRLREKNWQRMPFNGRGLNAVLLTHAHIDHSGYLPRLMLSGFQGPVYCTAGSADLLRILLPDAGFLQEEEARHANKYGYAKHHPALPLYTREDAERSLELLRPVGYDEVFSPVPGVSARFTRNGHIVGSAALNLELEGMRVAFSGDVGRPKDPVMRPPAPLPACDYLVVESTYGDRRHPPGDVAEELAAIINATVERGGTLVVPAFAVGRAQHLLHIIAGLKERGRVPAGLPVFLDSPMAIDATRTLLRHDEDHTLSAADEARMEAVAHCTGTPDESKRIDADPTPKIVISASGMATGGRVLHHLRRYLPDERSTVLLVGYQAAGTRGRSLREGADELKLHGQYVRVRARIATIDGLSAHADYAELLEGLRASGVRPTRVFVCHGEPGPADAMRRRLHDTLGLDAVVPSEGETVQLP
jgi:metallo-beta-lactamase family protein